MKASVAINGLVGMGAENAGVWELLAHLRSDDRAVVAGSAEEDDEAGPRDPLLHRIRRCFDGRGFIGVDAESGSDREAGGSARMGWNDPSETKRNSCSYDYSFHSFLLNSELPSALLICIIGNAFKNFSIV
jgi:hypothetical protein